MKALSRSHSTNAYGLAEFEAEDAVEDLIARADEAMYRERRVDVIPPGRLRSVLDLILARCGGTPAKALLTALTPVGPAAKLGAILEAGAYPATFFAPGGGSAKIVWTVRAAGKKPVVVASGSTNVRESAVRVIKVRLTKKGKALFRKSKVKITAKGSFASEGKTTTKVKRFTLKR